VKRRLFIVGLVLALLLLAALGAIVNAVPRRVL
jgi:hypothetical protein